jgi:hypothetical protein
MDRRRRSREFTEQLHGKAEPYRTAEGQSRIGRSNVAAWIADPTLTLSKGNRSGND